MARFLFVLLFVVLSEHIALSADEQPDVSSVVDTFQQLHEPDTLSTARVVENFFLGQSWRPAFTGRLDRVELWVDLLDPTVTSSSSVPTQPRPVASLESERGEVFPESTGSRFPKQVFYRDDGDGGSATLVEGLYSTAPVNSEDRPPTPPPNKDPRSHAETFMEAACANDTTASPRAAFAAEGVMDTPHIFLRIYSGGLPGTPGSVLVSGLVAAECSSEGGWVSFELVGEAAPTVQLGNDYYLVASGRQGKQHGLVPRWGYSSDGYAYGQAAFSFDGGEGWRVAPEYDFAFRTLIAASAPEIYSVHPRTGPIVGNTFVRIYGRSLGLESDDVAFVSIGGVPCTGAVVEELRQDSLVCKTGDATAIGVGVHPVSISTFSGGESAVAFTDFEYADPTRQVLVAPHARVHRGLEIDEDGVRYVAQYENPRAERGATVVAISPKGVVLGTVALPLRVRWVSCIVHDAIRSQLVLATATRPALVTRIATTPALRAWSPGPGLDDTTILELEPSEDEARAMVVVRSHGYVGVTDSSVASASRIKVVKFALDDLARVEDLVLPAALGPAVVSATSLGDASRIFFGTVAGVLVSIDVDNFALGGSIVLADGVVNDIVACSAASMLIAAVSPRSLIAIDASGTELHAGPQLVLNAEEGASNSHQHPNAIVADCENHRAYVGLSDDFAAHLLTVELPTDVTNLTLLAVGTLRLPGKQTKAVSGKLAAVGVAGSIATAVFGTDSGRLLEYPFGSYGDKRGDGEPCGSDVNCPTREYGTRHEPGYCCLSPGAAIGTCQPTQCEPSTDPSLVSVVLDAIAAGPAAYTSCKWDLFAEKSICDGSTSKTFLPDEGDSGLSAARCFEHIEAEAACGTFAFLSDSFCVCMPADTEVCVTSPDSSFDVWYHNCTEVPQGPDVHLFLNLGAEASVNTQGDYGAAVAALVAAAPDATFFTFSVPNEYHSASFSVETGHYTTSLSASASFDAGVLLYSGVPSPLFELAPGELTAIELTSVAGDGVETASATIVVVRERERLL